MYLLCLLRHSHLDLLELLLRPLPTLGSPLLRHHSLDLHRKQRTDRPMIRHPHVMPRVVQELYLTAPVTTAFAAATPEQDPVTPRRRPLLITTVVVVCADVVLVRRPELDLALLKITQPQTGVLAAGQEQLVSIDEFLEVLGFDGVHDRVAGHGVDPVVEVAGEDAELVVHDQGAVATVDEEGGGVFEVVGGLVEADGREGKVRLFEDGGDVVVAVDGLGLAGGEVAVCEADGCVF